MGIPDIRYSILHMIDKGKREVFGPWHMALLALDKRVKRQDSMRQSIANVTEVEVMRISAPGEACKLRRRAV
jgi:hypothetical protein